ncbi:MAG: hypothetical protein AAGJ08_18790, partial [Cyanobacteria bacterium P01_H01_bin.35]
DHQYCRSAFGCLHDGDLKHIRQQSHNALVSILFLLGRGNYQLSINELITCNTDATGHDIIHY